MVEFLNPEIRFEDLVSNYNFSSESARRIARDGIINPNETSSEMILRVAEALFSEEVKYKYPPDSILKTAESFVEFCDQGCITMSTPVLTSAGRHQEKPLAACSVIPVNFETHPEEALRYMHVYHGHNIGLGIDLNEYEEPLKVIFVVNKAVLEAAKQGKHERRIGNMGTISVRHPRILDVIELKKDPQYADYSWRFNFSVMCDDEFVDSVLNSETENSKLFFKIAEAAAKTGDPGLIFIDRLNRNNPTPGIGQYKSVAPCAEVGLIEGEACQFGYLNLGKFVENGTIDITKLSKAVFLLTRSLDNALDISIKNLAHPRGQEVMKAKRKIGIGVCGLSDIFIKLGLSYASLEAQRLAQDLMAFINYQSKLNSVRLAKERGPALAMKTHQRADQNRYYGDPSFIARYAKDSKWVKAKDWQTLADKIKKTGLLRNVSTVALPPTGRSSFIVDGSPGIEPWFTVLDADGDVNPLLIQKLREEGLWRDDIESEIKRRQRLGGIEKIPDSIKQLFITATELSPEQHLKITAAMQVYNDGAISKTVNLPSSATPEQVKNVLLKAYRYGLCGITIYVDKSRKNQPRQLGENG